MTDHMTNEALRRAIAEAKGAKFEKVNEGTYSVHWKGTVGYGCSYGHAAYHAALPDWPGDLGDAMTLCLEIALSRGWAIEITPYVHTCFVVAFMHAKTDKLVCYRKAKALAEALARLAYAALKAQAVSA